MPQTRPGLRKQPRQERARATVDRILDAGARVLIAYGYDGASTNRIAHEAELSPGSLYQYFNDKDAIVVAIVDRLTADVSTKIAAPFRSIAGLSVEDGARLILNTLVDALESQGDLLRAVVDQVPRFDRADGLAAFLERVGDFVYQTMVANSERLRHDDLTTPTWIVVNTTSHLAIRYVIDRPDITRECFVDEMTELLVGYVYRV